MKLQVHTIDAELLGSGVESRELALFLGALRSHQAVKIRDARLRVVDQVHDVMRRLFALPLERKNAFAARPLESGYGPMGRAKALDTGIPNLLETWYLQQDSCAAFPEELREALPLLNGFRHLVYDLGLLAWSAFCRVACQDEERVLALLRDHARGLHLMHYPALNAVPRVDARRQSRHCDMTLFTLLPAPTAPGLRINVEGRWFEVDIEKDELLLTPGLLLQHLTGGEYSACLHTVEHEDVLGAPRLSTPFFFKPLSTTTLFVAESFRSRPQARPGDVQLAEIEASYFQRAFAGTNLPG